MAFKFNPFTGLLDVVNTSTSGSSTDHHSGWRIIADGQTVVVEEFKQMVVFGLLENDGTLLVDGELILED